MTSVSTNVAPSTTFCTAPVRHTIARSPGLTVRAPTRISRPASAGIATLSTMPPNATTTIAIVSPATSGARRVRAPAVRFSADADTEPPTGMPWNTPLATFAAPCATKSRDASAADPSGLAKPPEIPAPWTRPTNASASAGTTSAGTWPSSGQVGVGRPCRVTPRSCSVATSDQPSTATAPDVSTTAITRPSEPIGVRSNSRMSRIVATPIAMLCQWSSPGDSTVCTARVTRLAPSGA